MPARKGTKTRKTTRASSSSAKKAKTKKSSGKNVKTSKPWAVLFWLAFAICIFGLYIFNREKINNGIQIIANALSSGETPDDKTPEVKDEEPPPPAKQPSTTQQPATTPVTQAPAQQPAAPSGAKQQPDSTPQTTSSQTAQNPPPAQRQPEPAAPATRERVLYFVQVDKSGYASRVQANRRLPVSDSPLTDVVQALIAGPNADEKSKGLISLIPPATKLLSASIRGNTAYLSFNEEFQYNTYGVEGHAGQLRQIVFTVTEFPNVADVQILIEGQRIDYLGEGVWIGSPVSRDML